MKTGEGSCSGAEGNRPHLRLVRACAADGGDAAQAAPSFMCSSCDEAYPTAAAMDRDGKGNFLVDTCPDCYVEILATEGIVPNAAEAQRIAGCRAVIAALGASRDAPS